MILAEKIVKLRKQAGWSQEELAEKMNISRQSVSKWESTNSIPDLNKIILLAEIFNVSTDFLLKDENETFDSPAEIQNSTNIQISLEQATAYISSKMEVSALTTKGVMISLCSVVPLLFFLAMAETNRMGITGNIAAALGIICIVVMVAIAVSFFIRINQYEKDTSLIDNEPFELAYGVHSVFQDKLEKFQPSYYRRLSLGIFLFIVSFIPMMLASMFYSGSDTVLMMLIVMLVIIAIGIFLVAPASAKYEAYNNILKESFTESVKSKRTKRAEKIAAFYWPLLTAIFLGWSLWTMQWNITWIIWPVGAVLFVALVGLMELLNKDD